MGRHSAAGDDDEDADLVEATVAAAAAVAVESRGRHSRGDEGDPVVSIAEAVPPAFVKQRPSPSTDTAPTPSIPAPIPAAAPEEAIFETQPIRPVEAPSPEPELSPTARDFALFRQHPDVRNRAIAAVLTPFVIYAVVMVVISRTDVFLIWIWIPLILAGVLMGLILDLGHKRYGTSGSADRP